MEQHQPSSTPTKKRRIVFRFKGDQIASSSSSRRSLPNDEDQRVPSGTYAKWRSRLVSNGLQCLYVSPISNSSSTTSMHIFPRHASVPKIMSSSPETIQVSSTPYAGPTLEALREGELFTCGVMPWYNMPVVSYPPGFVHPIFIADPETVDQPFEKRNFLAEQDEGRGEKGNGVVEGVGKCRKIAWVYSRVHPHFFECGGHLLHGQDVVIVVLAHRIWNVKKTAKLRLVSEFNVRDVVTSYEIWIRGNGKGEERRAGVVVARGACSDDSMWTPPPPLIRSPEYYAVCRLVEAIGFRPTLMWNTATTARSALMCADRFDAAENASANMACHDHWKRVFAEKSVSLALESIFSNQFFFFESLPTISKDLLEASIKRRNADEDFDSVAGSWSSASTLNRTLMIVRDATIRANISYSSSSSGSFLSVTSSSSSHPAGGDIHVVHRSDLERSLKETCLFLRLYTRSKLCKEQYSENDQAKLHRMLGPMHHMERYDISSSASSSVFFSSSGVVVGGEAEGNNSCSVNTHSGDAPPRDETAAGRGEDERGRRRRRSSAVASDAWTSEEIIDMHHVARLRVSRDPLARRVLEGRLARSPRLRADIQEAIDSYESTDRDEDPEYFNPQLRAISLGYVSNRPLMQAVRAELDDLRVDALLCTPVFYEWDRVICENQVYEHRVLFSKQFWTTKQVSTAWAISPDIRRRTIATSLTPPRPLLTTIQKIGVPIDRAICFVANHLVHCWHSSVRASNIYSYLKNAVPYSSLTPAWWSRNSMTDKLNYIQPRSYCTFEEAVADVKAGFEASILAIEKTVSMIETLLNKLTTFERWVEAAREARVKHTIPRLSSQAGGAGGAACAFADKVVSPTASTVSSFAFSSSKRSEGAATGGDAHVNPHISAGALIFGRGFPVCDEGEEIEVVIGAGQSVLVSVGNFESITEAATDSSAIGGGGRGRAGGMGARKATTADSSLVVKEYESEIESETASQKSSRILSGIRSAEAVIDYYGQEMVRNCGLLDKASIALCEFRKAMCIFDERTTEKIARIEEEDELVCDACFSDDACVLTAWGDAFCEVCGSSPKCPKSRDALGSLNVVMFDRLRSKPPPATPPCSNFQEAFVRAVRSIKDSLGGLGLMFVTEAPGVIQDLLCDEFREDIWLKAYYPPSEKRPTISVAPSKNTSWTLSIQELMTELFGDSMPKNVMEHQKTIAGLLGPHPPCVGAIIVCDINLGVGDANLSILAEIRHLCTTTSAPLFCVNVPGATLVEYMWEFFSRPDARQRRPMIEQASITKPTNSDLFNLENAEFIRKTILCPLLFKGVISVHEWNMMNESIDSRLHSSTEERQAQQQEEADTAEQEDAQERGEEGGAGGGAAATITTPLEAGYVQQQSVDAQAEEGDEDEDEEYEGEEDEEEEEEEDAY